MTGKSWMTSTVTAVECGSIAIIVLLGGAALVEHGVRTDFAGAESTSASSPAIDAGAASADESVDEVGGPTAAAPAEIAVAEVALQGDAVRSPIAVPQDTDDRAGSKHARRPEHAGERDLYAEFLSRASLGPGEIERAARAALSDDRRAYAKVAALRAVWDSGSSETSAIFLEAIASQPDESSARGESVPRFALSWLARHAKDSERARRVLEDVAWPANRAISPELRHVAAADLAAIANAVELVRIARRLEAEPNPSWIERVAPSLARNANTRDADAILLRLGLDPDALRRAPSAEE
jgi:hypothetical protein